MALLDSIKEKARSNPQRMAFPEAHDERMMAAAAQAVEEGIARAVLVGDEAALRALAAERGHDSDAFEYLSTADSARLDDIAERYGALPGTMLGSKAIRRRFDTDLLTLALAAEAVGDVDAMLAGIEASTGEVIMAGQLVVGLAEGIDTVSSVAVAEYPEGSGRSGSIAFGDSAVVVAPTSEELADIAISSCDTIAGLLGWEPRCALLSFSTCGSGRNEQSERVERAVALARERRPGLAIDGEFQLDSAIVPEVAAQKVRRESAVAGRANIVIFPDLNAGNIGVKIMQRLAGMDAIGPFLQGFRKVVSDCSRGASVEELVGNVAVSCVRAAALKGGE